MKMLVTLFLLGVLPLNAMEEIKLWNGDMPGRGAGKPESVQPDEGDDVIRLTNVSEPTLQLYLLEPTDQSRPFVIICPGGGYRILSMNSEGSEIAQWLNSIGVSAAVLKYRCPDNREGALADANQSIQLARKNAGKWGIDPNRIGMLGFSAGGHLTAACSNTEHRPDFSVLVYPAYLFKEGTTELVDEIKVSDQTPPAFVVQTKDDKKYYRSTLAYTAALDTAGIEVESHLFAKGGHGYGMRDRGHPVHTLWPKLCEAWMREMGYLK